MNWEHGLRRMLPSSRAEWTRLVFRFRPKGSVIFEYSVVDMDLACSTPIVSNLWLRRCVGLKTAVP